MWKWDRNKDCEEETRKREKRGNNTVWTFRFLFFFPLKWITLCFLLVYCVHQWCPCAPSLYLVMLWRHFSSFFLLLFCISEVLKGQDGVCLTGISGIKGGAGLINFDNWSFLQNSLGFLKYNSLNSVYRYLHPASCSLPCSPHSYDFKLTLVQSDICPLKTKPRLALAISSRSGRTAR